VKTQIFESAGLISGYRFGHLNTWLMNNSADKLINEHLRCTSALQHSSLLLIGYNLLNPEFESHKKHLPKMPITFCIYYLSLFIIFPSEDNGHILPCYNLWLRNKVE